MGFFAAIGRFFSTPLVIGPFDFGLSPLTLALRLVLPAAAGYVVYRLLLALLRRIVGRGRLSDEAQSTIILYVRLALRIGFFIGLFLLIYALFGANVAAFASVVWGILTAPVVEAGGSSVSLVTLLLIIPVSYLALRASRLAAAFVKSRLLTGISLSDATRFSVGSITQYLMLGLLLIVGLSMLGINLSSLSVLLGVLGIGIGFGLQNIVSSVIAGLVIIFERPIKEGDRVIVDEIEGDVTQIRLRSTVITTLTNETIIVPNYRLIDHKIHNYSHNDRQIWVVTVVQVAYGSDLEAAKRVLEGIGQDNPYRVVAQENGVLVRALAFEDSGVAMQLWTLISEARDKYAARSWANFQIHSRLGTAGITIPFPQRDLHLKDVPQNLALGAAASAPG
jgi:potassium efflux system protein